MTIKRIRFKSEEHRKKFAASDWYNECFSKYMPDEFWAKYDSNSLVGYMLVDADGKKIELPKDKGGGGIIFDDEEMFHFFDEVK